MEITLIRHGKPTLELKGLVRARDVYNVIKNYDDASIADTPPETASQQANKCSFIICSHLSRSIQSATALGVNTIHLSDPLFREIDTPHFKTGGIKLPVMAWGGLLRIMSVFGFARNGESLSMAKQRAKQATSTLIDLAHQHEHILLVGHGLLNILIARELLSRQWSGPRNPGWHYWQYGVYTYDSC